MVVKKKLDLQKRKEIFQGLEKQNHFYERLLELGQSEIDVLEAKGSVFDLSPLLKKKRILLSCIDEIEEKIARAKQKFREDQTLKEPIDLKIQASLSLQEDLLQKSIEQQRKSQSLLELVQAALLRKKESLEMKE